MLTYALVAGPNLSPRLVAALRQPDRPELAFRPTTHEVWSNPEGTVLFAAWQDGVDVGMGDGCHITPRGLTAFTGHVWPRTGAWCGSGSWAEQLADHLERHPQHDGTEDLLGVFTLVSLDAAGHGVVAPDGLGTSLVYRAERDGTTIVSSRASLAAGLGSADGVPRRDLLGAGWLAYADFPIGPSTGFAEVEAIPFGCHLEVTSRGVEIRERTPPWRTRCAAARDELVAGVRADIVTSARAALTYSTPERVLELTGGKDSRLVLALLLDDGIAGEFEYQTLGAPDLPDVMIAKDLAARFDLRHHVGPYRSTVLRAMERRERLAEANPGISRREIELRSSVGAWCAMRSAWELHIAEPPGDDRVSLTGLYGETLSTNYATSTRLRNHAQVRQDLLVSMKFGMAGILKPDALAHYRRELLDAAYEGFSTDDAPQDVMDAFYLRHRLHRWIGTTTEIAGHVRLLPLHSLFAVRAVFSLGIADRHGEWLPRELYRRSHEQLANLPFTNAGWRDRIEPLREPEPDEPPPLRPLHAVAPRPPARAVSIDLRRSVEAEDVDILRRHLVGDPTNPVFELVDRPAVEHALDDFSNLPDWSKRQLFGAFTAAVWLGGREITLERRTSSAGHSPNPAEPC